MKGVIKGSGEKTTYWLDGVQVSKDVFEQAFPDQPIGLTGGHSSSIWPRTSEALACHSSQVEAMNERNRKYGVNVTYDKQGFPQIPDAGEWRKLKRLEKVHENDSYNG